VDRLTRTAEQAPVRRPSLLVFGLRALLALLGGLLGYGVADWLLRREILTGGINAVYLTLLGMLSAYLVSGPLAVRGARGLRSLLVRARRVPPEAVLAGLVGTTVALVITVLLNTLLTSVPGFTWYWSLLLTLVLVTACSWFFVGNRQLFAGLRPGAVPALPPLPTERPKLLDTSAIIDGRVADIVASDFLDGKLVIPHFVLLELQNIADSSDPLRRNRGRRGLEVLDKLSAQTKLPLEVTHEDAPEASAVDEKLIRLCQRQGAALITTDYNLSRVAALQGVRVLNVNQLSGAVRAMFLPGERLSLHIVKEGREAGQGLAYLDDGTMVVVEDAQQYVDATIEVVVTSNLQTNMGRMIFARPRRHGE
jgi:uncharacterized protein YacL